MKKLLLAASSLALLSLATACNDSEDCVSNLDCSNDKICVSGECVSEGQNEECVMDEDCGGNYSCNQSTGICNSSCAGNDQCASGFECNDAGVCQLTGGNVTYNTVLLVSRTPDDSDEGSCRAPNPGADIDYVELVAAGTPVAPASADGEHGGSCGSEAQAYWETPDAVLIKDSIPAEVPGECLLSDQTAQSSPYYFMGIGQQYEAGETLAAETGRLVVSFNETFADGDLIKVYEVNGEDGEDGETCTNIDTARAGDRYSVYLVASGADVGAAGAGVELVAPNFIHLGEANGIGTFTITLD